MHVDGAEAARRKAADAAAAAAAAAELRASLDASSNEAATAPKVGEAYNHTGADETGKHANGSGHRPGPGGGGGGVSRVIGAAEAAERDKYNAEKRNEVRLATPHTGTSGSEVGDKNRGGTGTAAAGTRRGRGGAGAALGPLAQAYATKPCAPAAPCAAPALHSKAFRRDSDTSSSVSAQRGAAAAVEHRVCAAAAGASPAQTHARAVLLCSTTALWNTS